MSASARNIRALRIAGAVLVVLFGVWAGLRVYSTLAPGRVATGRPPVAGVRIPVGEASPPTQSDFDAGVSAAYDAGVPPPKIPERLPNFSLGDRTGRPTPISTWEGKSLILNFWATWCAPCRREIPLLESLYSVWGGRGVEVVGIAVDYPDKVRAYADELKIAYPLLIGDQDALDVISAFGVESPVFPFTVFTDRRGEVVTLYLGELHKAQADLILSVVQSLNQNRVQLPEARRTITEGLHRLPPGH
ncbi:MAG TPA: TlpA disulfide reductase family protein [Steroidobacteraceae bacterium]|jgi:thiol-disulfide isomerase/thioredoxin